MYINLMTWRVVQLSIRLLTAGGLGEDRIDGGGGEAAAKGTLEAIHSWLGKAGVVCDLRRPDMLRCALKIMDLALKTRDFALKMMIVCICRFAPAPLYNSFEECHKFVALLRTALKEA